MSRMWSFVIVAAILGILTSCSGDGTLPIMPGSPGDELALTDAAGQAERSPSSHVLWGFWQGITNKDTGNLEIIPLRGASFHMNTAGIMQNSGQPGLSFKINSFDYQTRTLDCDVSITHPIPNSDFRGFDVRGIFMGPGNTLNSKLDGGISFNKPDGCRLLNADGYTRWWNAVEFTSSGLFGYDDSRIVPGYLIPDTTLNPYKYFSDPLGPDDPVVPLVNESNRGTFSTDLPGGKLTRRYLIQFQEFNGAQQLGFHYAVDVSWALPTGNSRSPKPIEDFPAAASCPEAFHVEVDTSESRLWYQSDEQNGGSLTLSIEVFDWQAAANPDGIAGEVDSIWVESPTLFPNVRQVDLIPAQGSQANSGVFDISIPEVHPTGLDNQEVLVTVRSKNPTSYAGPNSDAEYPEYAYLAAYALVEVPVSENPQDFAGITVKSPNGGELWSAGDNHEITWNANADIEHIAIVLSLDSGQNYSYPITLSTDNDGAFTWYAIPEDYIGTRSRIKILDADNTETFDESDEDFTIFPRGEHPIELISPNGGETWGVDSAILIKWNAAPTMPNIRIELSKDSGNSFEYEIAPSTPNDGEYEWIIPDWAEGTTDIIKISDAESPGVFDVSDDVFTVNPAGMVYVDLKSPDGGEKILIGGEYSIAWEWSGDVPFVDILISVDSGMNYDHILAQNIPNFGVFDIFEDTWQLWPWLFDPDIWTSTELNCRIRVQASGSPSTSDESQADFKIPITLGILHQKIDESSDVDTDDDGIPDDCEIFIGSDPEDRDIDRDFFFDYDELFGFNFFNMPSYDPYGEIPRNEDGVIANNTTDVNDDGIHDGEGVDTDEDAIPNYLEYYGYTWDWQTGSFNLWDGEDTEVMYYKTDPMQVSTDQDPYSDYMETTKANMDVSVVSPGDSPMVPATPAIEIVLDHYLVTLNSDITTTTGGSETTGTSWEASMEESDTTSMEHGWEYGQEYKVGYSSGVPSIEVSASWKVHGNYGSSSTDTTSHSNGGSTEISENWSRAQSTNPTSAAYIKLFLKVYNNGTAAASNIIPSFTLMIGDRSIATFEQTNSQINHLSPGEVYPAADGVYWVIDSVDTGTGGVPISLTMDELSSLETGAPVKLVMTQMQADVMLLKDGQWQSAGNWAEYMARCEAVCTEVFIDNGEGDIKRALVYSDDSDSAPGVTMRDGLIWAAGGYTPEDGEYAGLPVIPFTKEDGSTVVLPLENWHLMIDSVTFQDMLDQEADFDEEHQGDPDPPPFNLFDTLLGPDSSFTLRAPRPEGLDPRLHFATLDEVNQRVLVCVTDYSDIESVKFVDKDGVQHDLTQMDPPSAFWYLNLSGYEASGLDPDDPQLEYLIIQYSLEKDIYEDYVCSPASLGIIYDVSEISPSILGTYFDGNYNTIEAEVSTNGGSPITSVLLTIQGYPSVTLTHQDGNTWFRDLDELGTYGGIYGPEGIEVLQVENSAGNDDISLVYGAQPLINITDSLHQADEEARREYNFHHSSTQFEYSPADIHMALVAIENSVTPRVRFDPDGDCPDLRVYKMPASTTKTTFDNITMTDFEDLYDLLLNRSQLEYDVSPQSSGTPTVGGSIFLLDTGTHYVKIRFTDFVPDDPNDDDSAKRVYFEIVTFAASDDERKFDYVIFDSPRGELNARLIPVSPDPFISSTAMFYDGMTWTESPMAYQGQEIWQTDVTIDSAADTFQYVEVTTEDGYIYQCRPTAVRVPYRMVYNVFRGTNSPVYWDFETGAAYSDHNLADFRVEWRDCENNGIDDFRSNLEFQWPNQSSTGCNYIVGTGNYPECKVIFDALSLTDIEDIATGDISGDFDYTFSDECNPNVNIWNGAIFIHKDAPYFTKMIMRSHSYRYIYFDAVTYELPDN